MRRYANVSRGQAVFETAIMMPLFLLGLFGIMYAVRQSAVSERVQLGVRYGGLVTARDNPYLSYSLYSVYTTIDSQSPVNLSKCPIADAQQATANRAVFWQPIGAQTPTCKSAVSTIATNKGASQTILLQSDWMKISAMTPTGGYLASHGVSTQTGSGQSVIATIAAENFFRSPDVGQLLQCGPLGSAVKASLEGADTINASNVPPTMMPASIAPSAIIAAPLACVTFAPVVPGSILPTVPPTLSSHPTVPPTAPPTPIPPPTPAPTAAPPTTTPTKQPATAAPTVPPPTTPPTPTPLPTVTSKPTPTPTPTPVPTPTPTPNPFGTLPPGASS